MDKKIEQSRISGRKRKDSENAIEYTPACSDSDENQENIFHGANETLLKNRKQQIRKGKEEFSKSREVSEKHQKSETFVKLDFEEINRNQGRFRKKASGKFTASDPIVTLEED